MIVKNEEHIIERALLSALPFIDAFYILDTGSTDDTKGIIERTLIPSIPGIIIDRPWEGFGPSRTRVLEFARKWGGFLLVLDADDYLEGDPTEMRACTRHDAYELTVHHGKLTYRKPHLLRAGKPWRYEGSTHEYLTCDEPFTTGHLTSPIYVCTADGASRKDPAQKFKENVELLTLDLHKDPHNARAVFYLAQEYKDAGDLKAALKYYQQRVTMVGWPEETWRAAYEAACLVEHDDEYDPFEAVDAYRYAFRLRPQRAEPLVDLARISRLHGAHSEALVYALAAGGIPLPSEERLFLDESFYGWRRDQELGLALHNTGQHTAAATIFEAMLTEDLPPYVEEQTRKNLAFCEAALRGR